MIDMDVINARVCTYKCGTCGYLATDIWLSHQAHYEAHLL